MRRKQKKIVYPDHIITQAKIAAGIHKIVPVFGDQEYLDKKFRYEQILKLYDKERCSKCKKNTPNLGWKEHYGWLCQPCFMPPKPVSNNEE